VTKKTESRTVEPDAELDICDVVCPMTFVKAKVALDDLEVGQILAIRLNDGEPTENVPRSLKEDGHRVLKLTDNHDGTYRLLVKKEPDIF
jgi:TusA-related sulfurtransferase